MSAGRAGTNEWTSNEWTRSISSGAGNAASFAVSDVSLPARESVMTTLSPSVWRPTRRMTSDGRPRCAVDPEDAVVLVDADLVGGRAANDVADVLYAGGVRGRRRFSPGVEGTPAAAPSIAMPSQPRGWACASAATPSARSVAPMPHPPVGSQHDASFARSRQGVARPAAR